MALRSRIAGTGSYVPKKVVTNKDLEALIETSDDWILERTGVRERRVAEEGENTSDLAYNASVLALEQAGLRGSDLDMVIVATVTPDMFFPATACLLQERLGAKGVPAFDLLAGCAGFVYGLSVADRMITGGLAKNVLVVGAEILSRILDWSDRNTCVLFADGAGAAVLVPERKDRGVLSTHLAADGGLGRLIHIPAGGSAQPASYASIEGRMHYIKMLGNEVFKVAVRALGEVSELALQANGFGPRDVDLFIPHQANLRIIKACAKRLDVPMEKVYVNVDRYGNTSSASIPIALDEAVREGRIQDGDLVLLASFGAGLSWGSAMIRW